MPRALCEDDAGKFRFMKRFGRMRLQEQVGVGVGRGERQKECAGS